MAELKCPHCGQAFTVDDTELSSIIQQIRDKEFEKDIEKRISELKEHMMKVTILQIMVIIIIINYYIAIWNILKKKLLILI